MIKTKRIYEEVEPEDGYRILVDRLWPRGISKERAALDEWNKEITPSSELRKWFNHQPPLYKEFIQKYKKELSDKTEVLTRLKDIANKGNLTLLYGSKDTVHNGANVLLEILQNIKTSKK